MEKLIIYFPGQFGKAIYMKKPARECYNLAGFFGI